MQITITIRGFSTLDTSPAQGHLLLDRSHLFQNNISGKMEFYNSKVTGSYLRHRLKLSSSTLTDCSLKGNFWLHNVSLYGIYLSLPKPVCLTLKEIAWWRDVP